MDKEKGGANEEHLLVATAQLVLVICSRLSVVRTLN